MPYSGDPASSQVDAIRFHLQDTSVTNPALTDNELMYLADRWKDLGDPMLIAAQAASTLSNRYASQVTISGDATSIAMEQLQDKYATLAKNLRHEYELAAGRQGQPYIANLDPGAILDTDPQPAFGTGMHDSPDVGRQDYGNFNGGNGGSYRDPSWADGFGA